MKKRMHNHVLVTLADRGFISQAKQLFSTVFWNSGWRGDYLLLAHEIPENELEWFLNKGILVKQCSPLPCNSNRKGDIITASKCYLFSEYFKKWEHVVYLDVDILTRGPIDGLLEVDGFGACYSLGQTIKDNLIHVDQIDLRVLEDLHNTFDLNRRAFNSGVMSFSSSIIKRSTFQEILTFFKKYVKIGFFGGDQLPFNLYFYDKWIELPPVYNQIVELGNYTGDPLELDGIIIHTVSFGNGPWDPQSVFYYEWRANLDRADLIDLDRIPQMRMYSPVEIQQRSKAVIHAYVMDGNANLRGLVKTLLRGGRYLLLNPVKGIRKIKEYFKTTKLNT